MRINEDYLDDISDSELVSQDVEMTNKKGPDAYPYQFMFYYWDVKGKDPDIHQRLEDWLDKCPYIETSSTIFTKRTPMKWSPDPNRKMMNIIFGCTHNMRKPSQIYRFINGVANLCFNNAAKSPVKTTAFHENTSSVFQYLDDLNSVVQIDMNLKSDEDETNFASVWREFLCYCAILLPEQVNVFDAMEKCFFFPYVEEEFKKNAHHYIFANFNDYGSKQTHEEIETKKHFLSIDNLIRYFGDVETNSVLLYQESIEGTSHTHIEFEVDAINKCKEVFKENKIFTYDIVYDSFTVSKSMKNNAALTLYLGISNDEKKQYFFNALMLFFNKDNMSSKEIIKHILK